MNQNQTKLWCILFITIPLYTPKVTLTLPTCEVLCMAPLTDNGSIDYNNY